jgi:hypothetical protein
LGIIEDNLPKKQALFKSKIGQNIIKWYSSSIFPAEQYLQILEANGIYLYIPISIPSLLEDDLSLDIHDL